MAHTISGNCGLAGANVQWIGALSSGVATKGRTTADGSGNYTTGSVLADGTYQITPYSPGNTFTPPFLQPTVSGADISNLNFTSSAIGQTGIWRRQGIVIIPNVVDNNNNTPSSGTQEITAIYEGNAQILSGTVFKMWFAGGLDVYYAESLDGLTWTRQVAACITGVGNPRVVKVGTNYYLYGTTGVLGSSINLYTGGTTGTTFTLANSAVLAPGAAGQWDSGQVWDFYVFEVVNGEWHALYTAEIAGSNQFNTGYATSPDGIVWTKSPSNPVLLNLFSTNVHKISNTYYAWGTIGVFIGGGQPFAIPSEGGRASSTDLVNWTGVTNVFQRTLINEGFGGVNGQTGTYGSLVEANGSTYFYYTTTPTGVDGLQFSIQCSIASMTMAQLANTQEQVFIPPASSLSVRGTAFGGGATASTTAVATALNVPAGDLIVVAVRSGSAGNTITSITDTAGNTYVPLTAVSNADFGPVQIFYAKNCIGNAANIVQANFGGSYTFTAICVWDIAGADLVNPFDKQVTGYTHNSVNFITSNTFSTSVPNEIIVSMATSFSTNDTYGSTGMSLPVFDATFPVGAANLYCGAQHAIVSAYQTNVSASMSHSVNKINPMAIVVASFKAANSGISSNSWTPRNRKFINKR